VTRRRLLVLVAVAVLAALAVAAGVVLLGGDDDDSRSDAAPAAETGPARDGTRGLERCSALADDSARACYAEVLELLVDEAREPAAALEEIAVAAYTSEGGFLLSNCHGLMHTVGREYAVARGVTLGNLMDVLPRTNEPGCSAGFAHGLITGVAPEIDVSRPEASAAVCEETTTRYQRYSCVHGFGHAFMRISGEELPEALRLCQALGPEAADCAQGAFHDYWFAVTGADDTERPETVVEDPRVLCGGQAPEFVRPCWYRAFVDDRPDEPVGSGADIEALCSGLDGLQREGCVTAASVVGPVEPQAQLSICTELRGEDVLSCIRGTKVQNLITSPGEELVALLRRCDTFPAATGLECYRWLGKVLAVLTNGEFEQLGCPAAPSERARQACVQGARASDEALETFS
jgi:hypothetical protein